MHLVFKYLQLFSLSLIFVVTPLRMAIYRCKVYMQVAYDWGFVGLKFQALSAFQRSDSTEFQHLHRSILNDQSTPKYLLDIQWSSVDHFLCDAAWLASCFNWREIQAQFTESSFRIYVHLQLTFEIDNQLQEIVFKNCI